MNFYNYMLIIQHEAMKAILKKQVNIGYQADEANNVVFLTDHTGQSAFCIPKKNFVLNSDNLKEMITLTEMFHVAATSDYGVEVTQEIWQDNKRRQLRKLHDSENDRDIWINDKFFGYFKGNKAVMYNYFSYKGGYMVSAYDSHSFEVLGISVGQKPKR